MKFFDFFENFTFFGKKSKFWKMLDFFQKKSIFWWKKWNFQKNRKTSKCFKIANFWDMNKKKKLQRDLSTKNRFLKKLVARAHFRARRAPKTTLLWDFPKWPNFGRPARNFEWCARGSARAPKIFWNSKSSDNFVPPSYLWFFHIS